MSTFAVFSYVKADITDEGKSGLEYIKHRRPPEILSEGGRGIDLMEIYADSVDFLETDTGGLKVSLQFNRTVKKKADVSKSL